MKCQVVRNSSISSSPEAQETKAVLDGHNHNIFGYQMLADAEITVLDCTVTHETTAMDVEEDGETWFIFGWPNRSEDVEC